MKSQEQDQERVVKVLERYKEPRSVDQIAMTARLKESEARWACEVLQRKGQLTVVAGGKYGLVAKETEKRFGHGQLQGAVISLLDSSSAGRTWTAEGVGTELGISKVRASEILSRLTQGGKIGRPARGQYQTLGIKKPKEETQQFKLTSLGKAETALPRPEDSTTTTPSVTLNMTITVSGVTCETVARMLGILNEQNIEQEGE